MLLFTSISNCLILALCSRVNRRPWFSITFIISCIFHSILALFIHLLFYLLSESSSCGPSISLYTEIFSGFWMMPVGVARLCFVQLLCNIKETSCNKTNIPLSIIVSYLCICSWLLVTFNKAYKFGPVSWVVPSFLPPYSPCNAWSNPMPADSSSSSPSQLLGPFSSIGLRALSKKSKMESRSDEVNWAETLNRAVLE